MRAVAPLFAILASCVTIFAGLVRLWWSKPKPSTVQDYGREVPPPPRRDVAPWLQTAAKWWLIIVVGGGTVVLFLIAILTLIDMST